MQDYVKPIDRIETCASQLNEIMDNLVDEFAAERAANRTINLSKCMGAILPALKKICIKKKEVSMDETQHVVKCPSCRGEFAVCPDSFTELFENSVAFSFCPLVNCTAGFFLDIYRVGGKIQSITITQE